MLKLKKVELVGFKSFCDRTELVFNGAGITAVVGPNGCGKSNVSDAINWVLGEQSAKSLRGGSMQDVIFNGTRERPPTSMAEVTLTLVDTDYHETAYAEAPEIEPTDAAAAFPTAMEHGRVAAHTRGNGQGLRTGSHQPSSRTQPHADEIVIARRLFRSGESEYLLNGSPCRLRDIQELFMGTGLGPESYAIIEQGRIGQILSSKPYDRRALIEEAAGVTKYKTKRRLAEARLESSRQNLNRVNDILEEVTRQVNSLKRQAAKARRYGELREQFRGRLRVVLASRYAELERQAVQSALEVSVAGNRLKELSAKVEALEQEHFDRSRAGYEQEEALRRQRDRIAALALEADRTRNRIAYQQQQQAELEKRLHEDEAQSAQVTSRLGALEEELAACRAALETAAGELETAQAEVAARVAELARAEEAHRSRESERDGLRVSLLVLMGEMAEFRNQLTQVEEYLAGLERQRERAEREQNDAAEEEASLREQQRALQARMARQQFELQSVVGERAAVETRLGELKEEAGRFSRHWERLRGEYADVRARRDSLDQILSHHAYTAEAVKKLFAANPDSGAAGADTLRPLGILADFIEVESRFEPLVEDFLADELEYVVVKSWDEAEQGVRLLRSEGEGRATFLVHRDAPLAESHTGHGLDSLPQGLLPLKDYVRLTNGLAATPDALLPKLAACYVTASAALARELALAHPQYYFLAPEGECFHGSTLSGGRRAGTGPLALKRELRELTQRAAELSAQINACASALRATEQDAARVAALVEKLRREEVECEKLTVGADQEWKQLAAQLQRSAERLSVTRLELERLEHERARAAEHAAGLRAKAAAHERAQQETEARIAEAVAAASELAEARSAAAAALAEARTRAAALEERRRGAAAAATRLHDLVLDARVQAAELERQLAFARQELERLARDNEEQQRHAAEVAEQRAAAEAAATELQQALEAGRRRLAELEEQTRTVRAELDEQRERKSAAEVALARQQSDLAHLGETCQNELGLPVTELGVDPAELLAGDALAEAEEQTRQLRAKIEALGPVNMMALEEYHETQQRYEFLNTQRQDLLDSIRDTQQAIQEIDTVSRQQFLEAFHGINANFQEIFRTLFDGGTGLMRLTEEENPNDSGVDLIAQPPGKRLQNVLLLSGGEKALTALALLLAIFRYQPSPFCVLDEVDAPLDDANIGRFTTLVEQMSAKTQFILITHSKKTMESAPVLYGVTMQEPGVSKLVSVKFQQPDETAGRSLAPQEVVGASA